MGVGQQSTSSTESARVVIPALWRFAPFVAAGAGLALVLLRSIPLGIPGEWTWNRSPPWDALGIGVSIVALAGYVGFAAAGARAMDRRPTKLVATAWLTLLPLVAIATQACWFWSAPAAAGLDRWPIAVVDPAVSGYFAEASRNWNVSEFLSNYRAWIEDQDPFHMGTHPPGLFLFQRAMLATAERRPDWVAWTARWAPARFWEGQTLVVGQRLSTPAMAAVAWGCALTWVASVATAIPLYFLCRRDADPGASWRAAVFWPMAPASSLFLPLGDCLYPALAVGIVALATAEPTWIRATLAGALWWLGMFASLAFLAVLALVVFTVVIDRIIARREGSPPGRSSWARMAGAFVAGVAAPWLAIWLVWGLPMASVWRVNLAKHASFYVAMPRSYWPWLGANLVEFACVVGPALMALALQASGSRGTAGRRLQALLIAWLATLATLDLWGRNLGEVARLWGFLAPFAGVGVARLAMLSRDRRWWLAALGAQGVGAIATLANVEPLLPIAVHAG